MAGSFLDSLKRVQSTAGTVAGAVAGAVEQRSNPEAAGAPAPQTKTGGSWMGRLIPKPFESRLVPSAPAAPVAPKPLSAYQTLLQKRLSGQDPTVQNAQQQQNTNASLNRYTALRTAQQTGAQGGLQQGGLQYQRGVDKAEGAAAEQNLSGQDRVNALARSQGEETMRMAHTADLEQERKNNDFINSLPPKAQQHLRQILAQGGDVQAEYAKMVGPDGTLLENYRDSTSAQTELQGFVDQVAIELGLDASDPKVQAEALKRFTGAHKTKDAPMTDAQRAEVIKKLNASSTFDLGVPENKDAFDYMEDTQLGQFNNDPAAQDAWASANAGKWVKINGQPYKVVGSNFDWQKDAAGNRIKGLDVTDAQGNRITIGPDGKPTTSFGSTRSTGDKLKSWATAGIL